MIAIHAPCWAQAFRPSVITSMQTLGRRLGLDLSTPRGQTCCGLPAWEAGRLDDATAAARRTLHLFQPYDTIVSPSASCLQMLRKHIPVLLRERPEGDEAAALARRSLGWCDFLAQNNGIERLGLRFTGKIAYFPPCQQDDDRAIRRLLDQVSGTDLLPDPSHQCCGAGANLNLRHPQISAAIARSVTGSLRLSDADLILTSDVGCLLHLAPLLKAAGAPPILHMAEFLAQIATPS